MKTNRFLNKIDKLIEKGKVSVTQKKLDDRFKKNIEAFDSVKARFIDEYKNYQPQNIKINIDDHGQINLINLHDKKNVYPSDPITFSKNQVENYLEKPHYFKSNFTRKLGDYFLQNQAINKIYQIQIEKKECSTKPIDLPVGMMIINGIGLGYIIDELINQIDIYNLCIIEPNKDIFFASLFTVDWKKIIDKFYNTPCHSIQLNIGLNNALTFQAIASLFNQTGEHQRLNVFIYHHLASAEHRSISMDLMCNIFGAYTPAGFLEDEVISLAHSKENLQKKIPILDPRKIKKTSTIPVFILANGPSLDNHIEFIKKHQNNAVLISCGTTLATLEKLNIVPHIHIEMERTSNTTLALVSGNSPEYLKNIICVGFNNLPSKALALFKHAFIVNKSTDSGSFLLDKLLNFETFKIDYGNPTVSNLGLAVAIALKFKNIILIGVDLAYGDGEQHHSKNSEYYNEDNKAFNSFYIGKTLIDAEGNFRENVKTTPELELSRKAMVLLIGCHPEVNIYNVNDGIKIQGAQPICISDLNIFKENSVTLSHQYILDFLSEISYSPKKLHHNDFKDKKINELCIDKITAIISNTKYRKDISSIKDMYADLNDCLAMLRKYKSSNIAYTALFGTFSTFLGYIYYAILHIKDDSHRRSIYHQTFDIFLEFLSTIQQQLQTHGLLPDSDDLKTV